MSTAFKPLTLPPGVVTTATKKMGSTNYAEVNMVRWTSAAAGGVPTGQLQPIGGQSKYAFTFASRCKKIHGWMGLDGLSRVAYLCEANLYVSVSGGALTDITPSDGITPPTPPSVGGYGDGLYDQGVQVAAAAAFTTASPNITMSSALPGITAGINVFDTAVVANLATTAAFTKTSPNIVMVSNPGTVKPGMDVYDTTTNLQIGTVLTYTGTALVLTTNALNAGALGDVLRFSVGSLGTVSTYSGTALVLAANALNASQGAHDLLNFGAYGEPRAIGSDAAIDKLPDAYSLQNFGAILLAMTSTDGRLLYWDPASAPGTLAAEVTPATGSTVPHGRCFVVTPERFVQIFGSYIDGTVNDGGSFRRFSWCNQEDYTNWAYSDLTTQAGFIDIEPASPIICAISTRSGTLFFTGKKAYVARYLGLPYVYNFTELGDNCTPWSPQSMVTTSSMVLWFSQQGPYSYDGTSILPIQCPVRTWVDDDIDLLQVREEACSVHVANFNEFWWFFPQGPQSNPNGFNTRAVIYNYKDGWWGQARCARSAGVTASYTSHTIMANGTVAYEHEYGNVYWDCDLPWIETFDLNIAGGNLVTVKQMIPDIDGAATNTLYSLFYRNSRSLGLPELQTTPSPPRADGYVDFRTTGRDIRLRIDLATPAGMIINGVSSDGTVLPVTVGQHLIDAVMRGDR